MSDYALDFDVGFLLPSDFLFDVLYPFPSDAELARESNSFFEFGPVVRPHPPSFDNGVSHCHAGGPVNYRLQLPETEKPPVESSSFTAMATARSGPRGSSTGSRGYVGTGCTEEKQKPTPVRGLPSGKQAVTDQRPPQMLLPQEWSYS